MEVSVISLCGPDCAWCGGCTGRSEREFALSCDECGSDAVELGDNNGPRLCIDCLKERDAAKRDAANAQQFFDRR
jgi:hypothetical protein